MSNGVYPNITVPDFYCKPADKYLCFAWISSKLNELGHNEKSLDLIARELQIFMGWDEDHKPIGTIKQNYYRMTESFKKLKQSK